MKTLIVIGTAFAIAIGATGARADDKDHCPTWGNIAKSIMEARQHGAPMDQLMALLNTDDDAANRAGRALVIEAYGQPRYTTESYRQKAIEDFSNGAMLACYR